jgi:hypothetical protein
MPSLWVKWRISPFDYTEITVNDVLGEVSHALHEPQCEARGENHGVQTFVVITKRGTYVLCRQCCKMLGLPMPAKSKY